MPKKIFLYFLILCSFLVSCVTMHEIIEMPSPTLQVGDGPHWDICTQSLYFVDIYAATNASSIFRYDSIEKKFYAARIIGEVAASFIIPIKCGKKRFPNEYAVGLDRGMKIIEWDGISNTASVIRTVFDTGCCPTCPTNRMDDGKADPKGRFYGGTLSASLCNFYTPANSSFYRYSKRSGLKKVLNHVKISNGLAFNARKRKCYYQDSCALNIVEMDWNPKTGALCNERVVFDFAENGTVPIWVADGLTIDCDGILYSAHAMGGEIWQIDPKNSALMQIIKMPTELITSMEFGGKDLRTLYVTSGSLPIDLYSEEVTDTQLSPSAGKVFMIKDLGPKGVPAYKLCA